MRANKNLKYKKFIMSQDETPDTREHVIPGTSKKFTGEDVEGYDFRGDFDMTEMLEKYSTTGFQATHLKEAIDLVKDMRDED